jgi:eukaryotic-like serine/threonine-protein kinase
MTTLRQDPGDLSQLLEDLARVPRLPVPEGLFSGLPPGTKVARFVIEREIGRGGFGVVYEANDPDLGRRVALKVLRQGIGVARTEAEWIRREAEAVARLSHPAIVTLFDSGSCEHGAYMVFELLQGEPLDAKIAREKIDDEQALQITAAVAGALEHAHGAGILHRDLKPANVFLCSSGAVKVLDFGIAQLFDREARPNSGTPRYMAPEQRDGRSEDGRTDLYSLGVLLLAMLRGGTPEVPALAPPRGASAAEKLAFDLTRAVPEERPSSARVVLDRLSAIEHGSQRRRAIAWTTVALVPFLLLAGWMASERWRHREAPVGERLVVAIASTKNETGTVELDHLSGALRTALSDSPRFRIVAPARMDAMLSEMGMKPAAADDRAHREAASRLGASAVVFPVVGREGTEYVATLTGRDVKSGGSNFQSEARAPTIDALPQALDGAIRSLRKGAGERAEDLAGNPRPMTDLTTPSLAAYREYALGVECQEALGEPGRGGAFERCGPHFRKALDSDPSFSLAHRALSMLLGVGSRDGAEARRHVDAALASSGRLSRRDEALARAWQESLAGNDDEALRRYSALLSDDPGDVETIYTAGDLLFHSRRYDEAVPFLARLVALGPSFHWALDHLVESYALTGRYEELAVLLDSIPHPGPSQFRPVVRGEGWLGRHDRAIELARQGLESQPGSSGRHLLLHALSAAHRVSEAQALAESLSAAEPGNPTAFLSRVFIGIKRGQSAKAWRLLDAPPKEIAAKLSLYDLALLKASLAAADRRLPRLRSEIKKLEHGAPESLPIAAPQLALLGTLADTTEMLRAVPPGGTAAMEIGALEAWKQGDVATAVSSLAALEKVAPRPDNALSPAYLLAEVAREEDPTEALAAADRFRRRLPIGPAGGWMYGRSLLVSAEAAWRLGRRDEAIQFIDQAERLLDEADAGFPLALETARLRKAIESKIPQQKGVHFGPR